MSTVVDLRESRALWRDPVYCLGFLKVASFFALSLLINYWAVRRATNLAGPSLPDTILDSIPMVDTHFLDYSLAFFLEYVACIFALIHAKRMLFFFSSLSLLVITRSIFVNLTHLGIPAGVVPTVSFFTQGGDLFFSGHTALPFLVALIYWDITFVRLLALFFTILMGIEVLVGHQHYTIDVAAAPFIVYGVYSAVRSLIPLNFQEYKNTRRNKGGVRGEEKEKTGEE